MHRQQLGWVSLGIGGGGVVALALGADGNAWGIGLTAGFIVAGVVLLLQANAPYALPVAFERNDQNQRVFRPQVPRWREQRRVKRAELRDRAADAAARLNKRLAEDRRFDPMQEQWLRQSLATSEAEREQLWADAMCLATERSIELINWYNAEMAAEALALYDQIGRRHPTVVGNVSRDVFERPPTSFGIEDVARNLEVWAKQI